MSKTKRPPLVWVTLGLLAALVATNTAFLILVRTGGPLVGVAFNAALLILVWRGQQRHYPTAMVGGLVGLTVHIAEVIAMGWSTYPMLMALNLILPGALAVVAWLAARQAQQQGRKG